MKILWALLFALTVCQGAKKAPNPIETISEYKDFKKVLRTRFNLMVVFHGANLDKTTRGLVSGVATATKGKGTFIKINCDESKKLCKKLKVSASRESFLMRHFKDGEFHKDYDWPLTENSLTAFILDPTGDPLWEEQPDASAVTFLSTPSSLSKAVKKSDDEGMLVMFYAPWCGYCKRMKPDFQQAAKEVKGKAVMAAMDVNKAVNDPVKEKYNITSFPTLIYFENGRRKFEFNGRTQKEFLDFLSTPYPRDPPEEPEEEAEVPWSEESPEILHLTDGDFDERLADEESVLVMFYAPWCGHCKRMKPEYAMAAREMKEKGIAGKLAAVDATKEQDLAKRFDVKGFPTISYFRKGELKFEAGEARKQEDIVKFMSDPKEPPPPPPPEKPWSEEALEVEHLDWQTFKPFLKKKKHVLVMFYAPWCGHCKAAKPEISAAADEMADNVKVKFAGVDCTADQDLCKQYGIRGYPTFKYFSYFDKEQADYEGGRKKEDFVAFMTDPKNPLKPQPPKGGEQWWKDHQGQEHLLHLHDKDFESKLKMVEHALVMFYAPWCGHCKAAKPEISAAATEMADNVKVKFAGVDCTADQDLCKQYGIRGYPTFKYFSYFNKEQADYEGGRKKEDFVAFMTDPTNPPRPQPPKGGEHWWKDHQGHEHLLHLHDKDFESKLKMVEHALVLYYAPWCGHCKNMKPDYAKAAEMAATSRELSGKSFTIAAVDATSERLAGGGVEIKGYPTILYFNYGKSPVAYTGERKAQNLFSFLKEKVFSSKSEL